MNQIESWIIEYKWLSDSRCLLRRKADALQLNGHAFATRMSRQCSALSCLHSLPAPHPLWAGAQAPRIMRVSALRLIATAYNHRSASSCETLLSFQPSHIAFFLNQL